jgi:hypothetical protein
VRHFRATIQSVLQETQRFVDAGPAGRQMFNESVLVINKRYTLVCDNTGHEFRSWSSDQPAGICEVCSQPAGLRSKHWEINLFGGRVVIPFNYVLFRPRV